MLTKAEMEDIWNNKPVGFLKQQVKNLKGKKKWKVILKPYFVHKEWLASEEYTVLAKNREDARLQVREFERKLFKVHGTNMQLLYDITEANE